MSFVIPGAGPARSSSPETLFRDLARRPDGPRHLWAHQADTLRTYLSHVADPDLAIELPTGAGKTLVGMLIAEWRRRERAERVVYLCPTVQLAKQALQDAAKTGIAAVDLTGSARNWSAADEHSYRSGEAIAVAHYAALFNSNPHLDDAHLVVFDDAHAAADSVASAWSVTIDASTSGYRQIVELLRTGLNSAAAERYLSREISGAQWQDAHMVAPEVAADHFDELSALLQEHTAGNSGRYSWQMISESLDACSIFVAADELVVRPVLPPTSMHEAFTLPRQRLYLSATLGSGGELERAFGRANINRMPAPEGWDERGTGRRYFIFPELISDFASARTDTAVEESLRRFITELMRLAGRSLLLTPSNRTLAAMKDALVPHDFTIVEAADIRDSIAPFTKHSPAVLALANRYDGIDLPDMACRAIVMADLPVGADPQERFFAHSLGAKRVLQERTRTRFAQGSGRATRNANDWALVIVLGRDLVAFCGQKDAQEGTHPEIRAELEFGLMNSQGRSAADVRSSIESFLKQDATWTDSVEPALRTLRESKIGSTPEPDTAALAASATYEVRAMDSAWRGDWAKAVRATEQALGALAGGSELRPYQAFWNYLAAQWARAAAESTDATYSGQAKKFDKAAVAAASRTTWMPHRQSGRAETPERSEAAAVDLYAARQVVKLARRFGSARKVTKNVNAMVEGLKQTRSADYERGLVDLGTLLGATSHKPDGEARADALWRWSEHLWIAWEAKSELKEINSVSATAIRQANTHLRAAASDLDEELPPGSLTVLAAPQSAVDPTALPLMGDALCIVTLAEVAAIADQVAGIWFELQGRLLSDAAEDELVALVVSAMTTEAVAPTELIPRLRGSLF